MNKIVSIVVVALIAVAGVALYQKAGTHTSEGVPTVVTSFYPLEYFVSEIVGDTMEVVNIGRGNDPHDFTPSAQDIVAMQNAALVVLQGAGLETWSEDIEHQLEDVGTPVFIATEHVVLRKTQEGTHDGHDEAHEDHGEEDEEMHENEHGDEHEEMHEDEHGDEHGEEAHDEHNHGEYDPHTWLDPILAAETVEHLAEELAAINPAHADLYAQNADVVVAELAQIDVEYREALSGTCSADEILISHDAFGYIADRYDVVMHPIAGLSTKDEPSAKLLAELKEEAEEGVLAVLTEENSVKDYAETIADETGIALVPISALAAGPITSDSDYIDGLRLNLESFKSGYGCVE